MWVDKRIPSILLHAHPGFKNHFKATLASTTGVFVRRWSPLLFRVGANNAPMFLSGPKDAAARALASVHRLGLSVIDQQTNQP